MSIAPVVGDSERLPYLWCGLRRPRQVTGDDGSGLYDLVDTPEYTGAIERPVPPTLGERNRAVP